MDVKQFITWELLVASIIFIIVLFFGCQRTATLPEEVNCDAGFIDHLDPNTAIICSFKSVDGSSADAQIKKEKCCVLFSERCTEIYCRANCQVTREEIICLERN